MKNLIPLTFFAALLFIVPVLTKAQTITTIAGTGTAGFSGDGGPAINAQLNQPDVIKFDKGGNMYIADEHNHVVRKISPSGIISAIAGIGGISGYSGDGAPATNAKLKQPTDIVFDTAGNMYIAELGNSVIRKVNTSGIISTFAGTHLGGYDGDGGPATAAKIYDPLGLVFDKVGNLYFSNNGFYVVRKIDTAGIITTIAGTGAMGYSGDNGPATDAQLNLTGFLAIGPSKELYITDYFNSRIRKVDASGIITTAFGDGTATGSGDGGPATAASIGHILALIFDSIGNIYMSERASPVIRKVNAAGIISTIAGTGIQGYSGDGGPATAAQFNHDFMCTAVEAIGNLYISDPYNNRIRKITYNHTAVNEVNHPCQNVSIYPNPAHNEITISATEKIESVAVVNLIGQEVYHQSYRKSEKTDIDISGFAKGIYFVKVNGVSAGKFVKE